MKEKTNEKLLIQLRHRYNQLRISELFLIFLQIIGIGICTLYVIANFFNISGNDYLLQMTYFTFYFKYDYLNAICLFISVILMFSRPFALSCKINELRLAIKYLENEASFGSTEFQRKVIERTKSYITDDDKEYQKRKTKEKETIEPHEKRMALRHKMIVLGIPGISILTGSLIFGLGWNVPEVVVVDLLIGYGLVIYEAYFYQKELKNKEAVVFSDKHKQMILPENKQKGMEKEFIYYKKICYMTHDRLANYGLVLDVASKATNILAILITILDTVGNTDFQRLFALSNPNINNWLSLIFMIASIIFFFADVVYKNKVTLEQIELEGCIGMEYTLENLQYLENKLAKKWNKDIFSRDALDIGRALYDFNNDLLVRSCFKKSQDTIPVSCMFTVERAFSGRIPRYKLTVLILWLCGFCGIVWGTEKWNNIIPVSIVALVLYDIILIVNAICLWNKEKEWIAFEKMQDERYHLNLVRTVKWDFYKEMSLHILAIVVLMYMQLLVNSKIIGVETFFIFIVITLGIGTAGYIGGRIKLNISVNKRFVFWGSLSLIAIGVMQSIVQYVSAYEGVRGYNILFSMIVLPLLIWSLGKYSENISSVEEINRLNIPWSLFACIVNAIIVCLLVYWFENPRENLDMASLYLNVFSELIVLVCMILILCQIIYVWKVISIAKNESRKFSVYFPYQLFKVAGFLIIIWEIMMLSLGRKVGCGSFWLIVLFYEICIWLCAFWLKYKLHIYMGKKQIVNVLGMALTVMGYCLFICLIA